MQAVANCRAQSDVKLSSFRIATLADAMHHLGDREAKKSAAR